MTHNRTYAPSMLGAHDETDPTCLGTLCPDCGCCMHCDNGCLSCYCRDRDCGCSLKDEEWD